MIEVIFDNVFVGGKSLYKKFYDQGFIFEFWVQTHGKTPLLNKQVTIKTIDCDFHKQVNTIDFDCYKDAIDFLYNK